MKKILLSLIIFIYVVTLHAQPNDNKETKPQPIRWAMITNYSLKGPGRYTYNKFTRAGNLGMHC